MRCAVGAGDEPGMCETPREPSRGRRTATRRSRSSRRRTDDGAAAAAVREQLTGSHGQLTATTVKTRKKGPVAGDGGCTSDRATRTVTRDRRFANSISCLFGHRFTCAERRVVTESRRRAAAVRLTGRSPHGSSAQRHLAVGEPAARPALLGGQRGVRGQRRRPAARRTRPPASRRPPRPCRSAGPRPAPSARARGRSRPAGCPRRAMDAPAACSRASASSSCSSGCGMTQRRWFFSGVSHQ